MAFSSTPTDGSSVPIPMSSAVPDGTNTPLAIEGGPSITTGGNTLTPVSMYVKDGNDITLGVSTDVANANSVIGQLKQIKSNTTLGQTTGIVQSTNNKSSGSVASLAKAFTTNNVAGNSIIVVCAVGNGTAPTISDTLTNSYTQTAPVANGTAFNVAVFFAVGIAAGANTVTVNNGGTTASIAMEIYEVSGLLAQKAAQPDITATATGSSATAATAAISASSPNELAFAGIGVGTAAQTITSGAGWTNDSGQQNPTTPAGLFSFISMSQFLEDTGAVLPQATFTTEPWAIAVATFTPVLLGVNGTVKLTDGTVTLAFGQNTMANSLPVTLASNQPNQNVTVSTALPSGAATIGAVTQASGPWTANITQIGGSAITLGSKTSANSYPVVIASDQGAITMIEPCIISTVNSSTATLTANSVFTGTSESSLNFSAISIEVFANVASAASGLSVQQSQDGANWDVADTFSVLASTAFNTTVNLVAQFFRMVYTNGVTNQTTFRLQIIKQPVDVVLPRTLTALGNLKTSLQEVAGAAVTNTNPVPTQEIEQPGYVAATSPPTATNAGSDTVYTFSAQVNRVIVQNNTSANVNYAFDAASTLGSLLLLPGTILVYPKKVTVLHLFTAATQNINGSTGSNIVVLGAN